MRSNAIFPHISFYFPLIIHGQKSITKNNIFSIFCNFATFKRKSPEFLIIELYFYGQRGYRIYLTYILDMSSKKLKNIIFIFLGILGDLKIFQISPIFWAYIRCRFLTMQNQGKVKRYMGKYCIRSHLSFGVHTFCFWAIFNL